MQQNTKVPVKLSLSASKKRVRLDVPLRISQLQQQVRTSFPGITGFSLYYVDDEGDKITVISDADLVEAQSVSEQLGRVISFTVDRTNSLECPVRPPVVAKESGRPVAPKAKTLPCSADKSAKRDSSCNVNPFLKMANTFLEHPEYLANAMRNFVGPAMGCNAAMFPGCPGAKCRKPSPTAGTVVELHSLSTVGFNGRRGMCDCVNPQTGRHQVSLFATKTAPARTVSVRPCNIIVVSAGFDKSTNEHEPRRKGPVSVPVTVLRKLSTMVPPKKKSVSVRKLPKSVPVPTATELVSVPTSSNPVTEVTSVEPTPVPATTEPVTLPTTEPRFVHPRTVSISAPASTNPPSVPTPAEPVTVAPTTESVTVAPIKASVSATKTTEPVAIAATTESVTVPATTESVKIPTATESVTVAPTTEPVTVAPATESVSVPKTNETVPTATTESVPVKVQQLLDMGFALPVETLKIILAAANGDVDRALTALGA